MVESRSQRRRRKKQTNPQAIMSVAAHIHELRTRVIWSLLGICVGAVAGWYLYDPFMAWVTEPLRSLHESELQLNFQTIGAAFDLKLRVALWIGVMLSSPWWILQLGLFVLPALKRKERWYLFSFGTAGVILFTSGAITGIWLAPRAVEILNSFTPQDALNLLKADMYVTFYMRLVLVFGASFLVPEVLVVLNFLGLLPARIMLKAWRWAIMIALIFAAIANPLPSPVPMLIQAGILVGLYLLAVGISYLRERRKAKKLKRQQTIDLRNTIQDDK